MEMMVSLALVGMMMTSLAVIMQSAVRYYMSSNTICEVEQATITASTALTIDLCETNKASVAPSSVVPTPTTWLTMASPRVQSTGKTNYYQDVTGDIQLFWASILGYYVDASGNLYRKVLSIPSNTKTVPSPSTFAADYAPTFFPTFATNQYHLVSSDIKYIELDADPNVSTLMYLGVYGQDAGATCILNVITMVSPRN